MIKLTMKQNEILIDADICNLKIKDGRVYVDSELVGIGDCEFEFVEDDNGYGV